MGFWTKLFGKKDDCCGGAPQSGGHCCGGEHDQARDAAEEPAEDTEGGSEE